MATRLLVIGKELILLVLVEKLAMYSMAVCMVTGNLLLHILLGYTLWDVYKS